MGLYVHEGRQGDLVTLREIVTGSACRAIVPAGYRGQVGELWYVRVLPPPVPGIVAHVAFSTPYVLLEPGLAEWKAYFRRVLPDSPPQARLDAYERHMKYGPTRTHWHDFVFEGYVNHRTEAIFLAGLPDVPESRPHSEMNHGRFRRCLGERHVRAGHERADGRPGARVAAQGGDPQRQDGADRVRADPA